jgi:helicase
MTRFLGLFIGIDRCASPDVNWLSCARRDAIALHALFADTLGPGGELLTDEQATRAALVERLERLADSDPDDVVVIAFSGHGTTTHELVTNDANPADLASSGISLSALNEMFVRIPARRLICILDCCFSGGIGAKVLQVESVPRHLYSAQNLLDRLSGRGRLVLTASRANEEAWEHAALGHGLLTHSLLEALQGADEVRESGKLPVYRLLEFVTRRVVDAASRLGRPQHPTLRGEIDGEMTWPIFHPGPVYSRFS